MINLVLQLPDQNQPNKLMLIHSYVEGKKIKKR